MQRNREGYAAVIQRVISIMMLAMLYLLTNTAAVYAECAWVLWWEESNSSFSYRTAEAHLTGARSDSREDHSWHILGSYATNTECEAHQESKINQMLKNWRKQKAEAKFGEHTIDHSPGTNIISKSSKYTGEYASSYSTHIRYLCLPDTIDPRTLKRK